MLKYNVIAQSDCDWYVFYEEYASNVYWLRV